MPMPATNNGWSSLVGNGLGGHRAPESVDSNLEAHGVHFVGERFEALATRAAGPLGHVGLRAAGIVCDTRVQQPR